MKIIIESPLLVDVQERDMPQALSWKPTSILNHDGYIPKQHLRGPVDPLIEWLICCTNINTKKVDIELHFDENESSIVIRDQE